MYQPFGHIGDKSRSTAANRFQRWFKRLQ